MNDNSHIDLKDIRLMFETFEKQNINFIEILFTEYKIINPKYQEIANELFDIADDIARINRNAALRTMSGMSMEKYKALKHPYPSIIDRIEKYGYDCYSDDTYFLTDTGYKLFDEITSNDKLATINFDGNLEFQTYINRVEKTGDHKLYNIETVNSRFIITENHNIYSSRATNVGTGSKFNILKQKWELKSLKYCMENEKYQHILSFPQNNNCEYNITDDKLKLIGAYISEGTMTFYKTNVKSLHIYQSSNGNKEFFTMMDSIGIKSKKYNYVRKNAIETLWCFDKIISKEIYNMCGHLSHKKRLPSFINELSKRQCEILLNSLMLGDGTVSKTRRTYYTCNKKLAHDVMNLGLLCGKETVMYGGEKGFETKGSFGRGIQFHVSVRNKEIKPKFIVFDDFNKSRNYHIKEVRTGNSRVVCFETNNGTLITMSGGKSATQGNCKQLHHIIRLNYFLKDFTLGKSYRECLVGTKEQQEYLKFIKIPGNIELKEAEELALKYDAENKEIKDKHLLPNDIVNHDTINKLKDIIYKAIKINFNSENDLGF